MDLLGHLWFSCTKPLMRGLFLCYLCVGRNRETKIDILWGFHISLFFGTADLLP